MGGAGIGNTGHIVNVLGHTVVPVGLGHDAAVAVAHHLHVLSFVAGGGVAVVGPEEGADLLFLAGSSQLLDAVGRDLHDFCRAQLPDHLVAQLLTGVVLEGDAVAVIVSLNDDGKSAHLVPGGNQVSAVLQNQDGGGALNHFLGKADALAEGALLVDHGGNQLVGIDAAAGHGLEMSAAEGQVLLDQLVGIVDDAHRADCINAQLGTDQDGLGIGVGNAADGGSSLHLIQDALKLGAEGGILNVVDFALHADLTVPCSHAAPAGAQVGMVVRTEKHIQNTVAAGCGAKETAHDKTPP